MATMPSMSVLSVEILSERDLIEATRDGDHRAFEELYARYQGRIGAFIHSRVRDHGRAEDVAQEVFISALRRLRASSQEIVFKPWIYEIAKNACIDEYRRSLRGREVPLDDDGEDRIASRLQSTAPTPPAAVEAKEQLSDLRGAFGVLSDHHHQLIVMREFEGRSYDEIGARTGMSRQMVESALFRARRKLTDEYEELASGRRCLQIQSAVEAGRVTSAASLGLRERRRFARHLAHCQPCRMHAQLAGVDESLLTPRRGIGAKIAGLLPFPLLRWPWAGRRARAAVAELGAHPEALHTLHRVSEPAAATSLGGAAVAAAVLALAGTGAVVAPDMSHGQGITREHLASAAVSSHRFAPSAVAPTRAAAPVIPPGTQAHLRVSGSAVTVRQATVSTLHVSRTPRRHTASPVSRPPAGTATGSGSGTPTGGAGGVTHRIGLPVRPGATPSAGTVVRASGGSLADSIGAATHALTSLTATAPVTGAMSSLGTTLSGVTRTTTADLGRTADATTAGATSVAGATGSAALSTFAGATGALRGVVHHLTGH